MIVSLLTLLTLLGRLRRAAPPLEFGELRRACMQGEAWAMRAFVERYENLVWHTVMAYMSGATREDQEEAVSNTFFALLGQNAQLLGRYDALRGTSPEGYIRQQAIFQAWNRQRLRSSVVRRVETSLEGFVTEAGPSFQLPSPAPGPEQSLLQAHELSHFRQRLVERLSPALQLTFELLYERELEPVEAASVLGCSIENLYVRKNRIAQTVQQLLRVRRGEEAQA